MELKENLNELLIIILASLMLAIGVSLKNSNLIIYTMISFFIIIIANTAMKKFAGYLLEINVKTKFWSIYHFGFRKDSHFKRPVPMLWLPVVLSIFTKGYVWWLAILEFDVEAKTERVSRRHGLYRFTEVTEWHVAWVAIWGLAANIILAVIAYLVGFEFFARLNLYYAAWSLLPLSSLDGAKIFFGSRGLWTAITIIVALFLVWGLIVV